ncbi:porin family protein [Maribacter halichondriae]|uniref:porin family protein n=1 Tax=Maribacter halichondriae TaxID=2980554 RepID=UPI002358FCD3|nr:porin family protein [Maribacter sp. Hal144]
MKKIKIVIITIVFGLLSFNSFAQFGVKAGLGVSNWTLKDRDVNASQELVNAGFAFQTGFGFEIDFGDMVSLEPALLFSQKSFSIESTDAFDFTKVKTLFVEMPVNVKVYVVSLGNSARLYALGGGYVAYMVSGKLNGEKIDIGSKSTDDFKAMDGGVNVGVGAQLFDALNVDISGGIGIANLSNDQTNGLTSRLSVVRLTVTYQFGG